MLTGERKRGGAVVEGQLLHVHRPTLGGMAPQAIDLEAGTVRGGLRLHEPGHTNQENYR